MLHIADVCFLEAPQWQLVFKAWMCRYCICRLKDPLKIDPYKVWTREAPYNEDVAGAQKLGSPCKEHFKSSLATNWEQRNIQEVRYLICSCKAILFAKLFHGRFYAVLWAAPLKVCSKLKKKKEKRKRNKTKKREKKTQKTKKKRKQTNKQTKQKQKQKTNKQTNTLSTFLPTKQFILRPWTKKKKEKGFERANKFTKLAKFPSPFWMSRTTVCVLLLHCSYNIDK